MRNRFYAPRYLVVLLLIASLLATSASAFAQGKSASMIKNLDWRIDGDQIIITYDMDTPADDQYNLSIILLNEDDPDFHLTPTALHGDIGAVKLGGKGKKIVWDFRKDLDYGLEGGKYYFQIDAKKIEQSQPWKYLAIGGGVAAAGVLTFLLVKGGGESTSGGDLPTPPGRP